MIGQKRIPSREGGIEIHVEEIAKRLSEKGHCVDAYCRNGDKNLTKYEGINIIRVPTIDSKSLDAIVYSFIATMKALFKSYDVYHFHALGPSTMAILPKILGKKVVCTVHGLDWQRAKWGGFAKAYLKFGEYCSAKFAHKTIVLSKSVEEYYKNKYHITPIFMKNGVNPPVKETAILIKEKFGLEKDSYILFLARIVPEKGLHYLIDAYSKINTDKKLVIAGDSSHSDDYCDEIKRKAAENKNIVMTGFVQGKMLNELYSNAYVYVLPSDIEGMPLSLLEAFSYGNAILTSDIPENAEVVQDKGLTFKKNDIADLTDKLQFIIDNPKCCIEFKNGAAEHILKLCNWDEVADGLEQLYSDICSRR